MYQSPLAKFIGTLSTISSVIGLIYFFINPTVTIICGIISIINSIIQVLFSDQNSLTTETLTIFISIIVALIIHKPIFQTVCFALCIGDVLFLLLGWIHLIIIFKNKF